MSNLGSTLVAVIAVLVALYIGLLNWKTAHYRLSLDLYEKRFAVYEVAKIFLFRVAIQGQVTNQDYANLYNGIRDAEFLFDEKIKKLSQCHP